MKKTLAGHKPTTIINIKPAKASAKADSLGPKVATGPKVTNNIAASNTAACGNNITRIKISTATTKANVVQRVPLVVVGPKATLGPKLSAQSPPHKLIIHNNVRPMPHRPSVRFSVRVRVAFFDKLQGQVVARGVKHIDKPEVIMLKNKK